MRCITDRIAEETGGLCMLLYQPSRAGRNDGESGSVQWDAAFRSRIMITSPDPEDLTVRQLTRIKSNFSAKGETIELRWNKSGVFLRQEEIDAQTPSYEVAARLNKPRRVFLNLLDKFTKQNRPVSEAVSSPNYAPKVFAAEEAAEGCDSDSLANAMRRLFDAGEIINLAYGPPSRPSRRIVKVVET